MTAFRENEQLPVLTEEMMRRLNEVRAESLRGRIPVQSAVSSLLSSGSISGHGRVRPFIDVTFRPFPQDEIAQTFCEPFSRAVVLIALMASL